MVKLKRIEYLSLGKRYLKNKVRFKLGHHSPIMAFWELTNICNSKCSYCNIWRIGKHHYPKEKELNTNDCLDLIDYLSEIGVLIMNFNGGDYLFRTDLPLILERAKKKKMLTIVNTNGILLKNVSKSIKDFSDMIFVLLDSTDEKINDEIRGVKGSLKKTVEGIQEAKSLGLKISIRTPVHKKNIDDLDKIAEFCENLGIKFYPHPLVVVPVEFRDESEANNLIINTDIYLEKINELKKKYKNIGISKNYLKFLKDGGFFNAVPCDAQKKVVSIKPDGSFVYPCAFNPKNRGHFKSRKFGISENYPEDCKGCIHSCFFSVYDIWNYGLGVII